ncbi:MAG: DNA-directed RNA polymerases I, II, and III subunit RPABC3 [Streblomastix strix]|uniref:DNA-directed RNA polymerases I, II, and III subunit RPABC3 n=1 Tax=Streblomastix strix TaxID=222440 RepID=A0A5J4W6N8_9EUKA|nr:MAG: DNA-directed RNA polymerases I, II, and III subunit RPABC3 [Streblomastix strix]
METLVEEVFRILDIDKGGQKFKSVSRLEAVGINHNLKLKLDYNSDIYTLIPHDKFLLAMTLVTNETLIPSFDYVMSGKVFKEEFSPPNEIAIYISYGGLLMELIGDKDALSRLALDNDVYLHIKKIE